MIDLILFSFSSSCTFKLLKLSSELIVHAGLPKDDIIKHLRINFIRKRLEQYVFPEGAFDLRDLFEEIIKNAEDFLTSLNLPYRVMELCTGEMGAGQRTEGGCGNAPMETAAGWRAG